ncbi:MAG: neutral/alkaline non-lysosomal ceramidase N-terminal domain-containing protein [Acidobacteriota bacterium]
MKRALYLLLLAVIVFRMDSRGQDQPVRAGAEMKAGLATVVITPSKPVWMAGYAARTKPAEGKLHDLYAKAIAIEDAEGNRVVLVTSDLLGFTQDLAMSITERAARDFKLRRDQIILNASHTHSGPVVRQSLIGAYDLPADQVKLINEYSAELENKVVDLIGRSLKDLAPARVSYGVGLAGFAMNRRQMTPKGIVGGVNPEGVVDRDVPVLRVETPAGKLRGIVFGYACHNTTLTGEFLQYSGDYAGFAALAVEKEHPGATALFVAGCGADVNPAPRSRLDLAEDHGQELAQAVESVLQGARTPVSGTIRTAYDLAGLPFATPPSRADFESRLKDQNVFVRRHAQRMLDRLERDGRLETEYPCPVQILRIGKDFTLVAIGGEVVTDYSLRLKKEIEGRVWVAGYSNDVFAYVPSARMYEEGGYEVNESMIYYDHPVAFAPETEGIIIRRIHALLKKTGGKARQ